MKSVESRTGFQDDSHFGALKSWIIQHTGLSYYNDKDRDFAAAIERSYESSPPAALTILKRVAADRAGELDRIIEELTIGETFFFRHAEMFEALRSIVFPDLLKNKSVPHLRIWSAGCSIGAEPYSLAILLRDLAKLNKLDLSVEIIGTDINRRFLRIAEKAEYELWALRGLDPVERARCFTQVGTKWRLRDEYREGVSFRFHNLASDVFPDPSANLFSFDLVICRNVMIYFDVPTIRHLAGEFHKTLVPGGWLVVGHAEPHTEIFRQFHTINAPGAVLYQRASVEGRAKPALPPAAPRILPTLRDLVLPELPTVPLAKEVAQTTPMALVQEQPTDLVELLTAEQNLLEAQKFCQGLIEKDPLRPEHHYFMALIYFQLSDYSDAARCLKQAVYLDHGFVLAHYFLGVASAALGKDSKRHFRNAQNLADTMDAGEVLPYGDGLTAGELRHLVSHHSEL